MNLNMPVREVLEYLDNPHSDVLGEFFALLLRHEYESAQYALNCNITRYDSAVENLEDGAVVPDYIATDLADSLNVFTAFATLMKYYGVMGNE